MYFWPSAARHLSCCVGHVCFGAFPHCSNFPVLTHTPASSFIKIRLTYTSCKNAVAASALGWVSLRSTCCPFLNVTFPPRLTISLPVNRTAVARVSLCKAGSLRQENREYGIGTGIWDLVALFLGAAGLWLPPLHALMLRLCVIYAKCVARI